MEVNISRDEISALIIDTVEAFAGENSIEINLPCNEETRLFGGNSVFDSMALVSLIVQIEEALEEKIGESLILADEKAMSRRTSPFSNISSLSEYVFEILYKV
jgi:acyl carrier protein